MRLRDQFRCPRSRRQISTAVRAAAILLTGTPLRHRGEYKTHLTNVQLYCHQQTSIITATVEDSKQLGQHKLYMCVYIECGGWGRGFKSREETKGAIPPATLKTTLLVTGRLWESCTVECCFSPPNQWSPLAVSYIESVTITFLAGLVIFLHRGLWSCGGQGRAHCCVCTCHKRARESRARCYDKSISGEVTVEEQDRG